MGKKQHVVISGGGLVGSLSAIYLMKRNFDVTVYEFREDLRNATAETGRSINLIITSRGLFALRNLGLEEIALEISAPVLGRMMHSQDLSQPTPFQPYGIKPEEINYSISRTTLNQKLIDIAEKQGAKFVFQQQLQGIDFDVMKAKFADLSKGQAADKGAPMYDVTADFFIGTDGVASKTRESILAKLQSEGVKEAIFTPDHLGISYKEIVFPAAASGDYQIDGKALHIWPRGPQFLMALADLKGSFTGTLYLPNGLAKLDIPATARVASFEDLMKSPQAVEDYFKEVYPDIPTLVPDYKEQFLSRQHSVLATVRCKHWHYQGKAVIMGDGAHGVCPFLGQGMNLGFESIVVLDKLFEKHGIRGDVDKLDADKMGAVFQEFNAHHEPSGKAIADMAVRNFTEMSFKVSQQEFLDRKALENKIEATYPTTFRSRYYMVTKTLIPFKQVEEGGEHADRVVDKVQAGMKASGKKATDADPFAGVNVPAVIEELFTKPFVNKYGYDIASPLKAYY